MESFSSIRYQDIPETIADLEWADLITIDLSQFDEPGGKPKLAAQLKNAISTIGFFYITNFGLAGADIDRQFALAKAIFDLPEEEKREYRVGHTKAGYFGWKPKGNRTQGHGLYDPLELYDDPKWNEVYGDIPRPSPLVNAAAECEKFQRHLAFNVVRPLLILCAIIMELDDEEALWKLHNYEAESWCHLRYMLYHPRTEQELAIMKEHNIEHNVYGHTDFGSITLLMRQPIAGLQIRPYGEQTWKWVKPMKNSITVNVADMLSFLTGGYLESSIHRVALPPEDQRDIPRYAVLYFAGPDHNTILNPIQSPVLEREQVEGNNDRAMPPEGVTVGQWVDARFAGLTANYASNRENKVVVKGVEVKSYA